MDIFVVSRSRWRKSLTLLSLGKLSSRVKLIVPRDQYDRYRYMAEMYRCELIPFDGCGIAQKRWFCGEISTSHKFLMLDDDLTLLKRKSPSSTELWQPGLSERTQLASETLHAVEKTLDKYAHCSISARQYNHAWGPDGEECGRPGFANAYHRDKFLECEHGRVRVMEDFDITLQLLRRGYKNMIISQYAVRQPMSQAEGGCSDYRTPEVQSEAALKLCQLHPLYVSMRETDHREGGDWFGERDDVRVKWKQAWSDSQR
jgi:hypothetical protein